MRVWVCIQSMKYKVPLYIRFQNSSLVKSVIMELETRFQAKKSKSSGEHTFFNNLFERLHK